MRLQTESRSHTDFREVVRKCAGTVSTISPGERILVIDEDKVRLAAILLACFELGIVSVPLAPDTPPEQAAMIVAHSRASWTCTHGKLCKVADPATSPPELRVIIYTSGTTGACKGVMLSKRNIISNASSVSRLHRFAEAPHCSPLPLYHVNALCMSLFGCYCSNSTLVLVERYNPATILDICAQHSCGTLSLVPTLLSRLLETSAKWPDCLRYIITAAAPISQRVSKEFFSRFGPRLRQGYGLSEATNFSFVMPLLDSAAFRAEMVDQYPPVGLPVDGTEFCIDQGEVVVRGDNVFMGYLDNPTETARALQNGWLRTGDLGEMRNGLLVLKGRKKEIILRGGTTIYPINVESYYASRGIPGPVAVAVADDDLGEDVGLALESCEPESVLPVLDNFPIQHQPCSLYFGKIQRTATGKVQRMRMGSRMLTGYIPPIQICSVSNDELIKVLRTKLTAMFELFQEKSCAVGSCKYLCLDLIECFEHVGLYECLKKAPVGEPLCCLHLLSAGKGLTRLEILSAVAQRYKPREWGFARLRAGRDDLGGLVWASP